MPYDKLQGIVWSCKDTHYGWFDLVETKIEGDEQIFVFKGKNAFSYETDNRFREVIFTDENGNELVYYAREFNPFISVVSEVRMYSPDEYIIVEYTPEAKEIVDGVKWRLSDSETYCIGEVETDGMQTFRHVCFNDKDTYVNYYYDGVCYEKITVNSSYDEDETEKHQVIVDGKWVPVE